jgi:hypothetical protein
MKRKYYKNIIKSYISKKASLTGRNPNDRGIPKTTSNSQAYFLNLSQNDAGLNAQHHGGTHAPKLRLRITGRIIQQIILKLKPGLSHIQTQPVLHSGHLRKFHQSPILLHPRRSNPKTIIDHQRSH